MKILAVDDDPIILELLSHFIEGMTDHTLVTAECAADALEAIKDNARAPFDSFLLDIQMPVTDGIQLASQIRAMKQYMDAPILMLTAMSEKSYIDAAFSAGATDYVTKPFEMTELKARLSLVERAVDGLATRTSKVFAAKAVTHHDGRPERAVQLHEPMAIHDVNNLIEFMALENYVQQLSRSDLFGRSVLPSTSAMSKSSTKTCRTSNSAACSAMSERSFRIRWKGASSSCLTQAAARLYASQKAAGALIPSFWRIISTFRWQKPNCSITVVNTSTHVFAPARRCG